MKLLISFTLVFATLIGHAQNFKNHLEKEGLKGKVKTHIKYDCGTFDCDKGERVKHTVTSYNEYGNKTGIVYNSSGKLYSSYTYKYDNKNRPIEQSGKVVSDGFTSKFTWTYHPNNQIKEESYFEKGFVRTVKTFDTSGNKIKHLDYTNNGTPEEEIIWNYNKKGLLTERLDSDLRAKDVQPEKTVYTYDKNDKLQSKISYKISGAVNKKTIYEYSPDNTLEKELSYYENGNLYSETLYNREGSETQFKKYQSSGKFFMHREYKYDSNNNKTEEIKYDKEGRIEKRSTYQLDVNGNIIEEKEFEADGSLKKNQLENTTVTTIKSSGLSTSLEIP